jgi:hypothetical protein
MKSILDASTFERIWHELDEGTDAHTNATPSHIRVRLRCNGEVVRIRWPATPAMRGVEYGLSRIQFVCPRCGQRHESVVFPEDDEL